MENIWKAIFLCQNLKQQLNCSIEEYDPLVCIDEIDFCYILIVGPW